MVEAAPSSPFESPEPDFLLEFLIVALDPPAHLGNINELPERYRGISQIWLCLRVRNFGEERPFRLLVSAGRFWCLVFG